MYIRIYLNSNCIWLTIFHIERKLVYLNFYLYYIYTLTELAIYTMVAILCLSQKQKGTRLVTGLDAKSPPSSIPPMMAPS